MSKRLLSLWLFLTDWISCMIAWALFFCYRKRVEMDGFDFSAVEGDVNFLAGIMLVPLAWLGWFFFLGHYRMPWQKTRTYWAVSTFGAVVAGSLVLLFTVMRDDVTHDYVTYLETFVVVLLVHAFFLILSRSLVFAWWKATSLKRHNALSGFLITSDFSEKWAIELPRGVRMDGRINEDHTPVINQLAQFDRIFIHTLDGDFLYRLISTGSALADRIQISLSDPTYRHSRQEWNVEPLPGENWLTLRPAGWSPYERHIKRGMDVIISVIASVCLSPLMIWCAYGVRRSGPGPIIFKQARIGRHGRQFTIWKFRSMNLDAEDQGPALSSDGDERCTAWGKTMRKWRLDELPQFYNVLRGEMSMVGPRPERPFYMEKLKNEVPGYDKILCVRPGITSWGQIKFGYASSVSQMIQRLRYDMLYVENLSLILDLRILYFTILVLWQGEGK